MPLKGGVEGGLGSLHQTSFGFADAEFDNNTSILNLPTA